MFLGIVWFFITVIGSFICLFRFRHKNNMFYVAKAAGWQLRWIFGMRAHVKQEFTELPDKAVYISNHQNNLDIIAMAKTLQPNTQTIGKTQLGYLPFFGWLYYLAGNILLPRADARKSLKQLDQVAQKIKNDGLSVWLFPEGTRSKGRYELATYKRGAFITAIKAQVPIVPVVCSKLTNFKMGRLDNGQAIISFLEPVSTKGLKPSDAQWLAEYCQELTLQEFRRLNQKVAANDFSDTRDNTWFTPVPADKWLAEHEPPAAPAKEAKTANAQTAEANAQTADANATVAVNAQAVQVEPAEQPKA